MTAPTLTLRDLNRATLARQMLLAREATEVAAALERLIALQAQWPKPPFVGLWSRLSDFRRGDLTRSVHGRELVRATLFRATIHLVAARDYQAWRPLLQPSLSKGLKMLGKRSEGIDAGQLVNLARAFFDETPATFEALRAHLSERYPDLDERAMGHTVRLSLPLIQVPTDAAWGYPQTTDWATAATWLGPPGGEDDLPGLVRRYLGAFGPASPADMQTWTGLSGLKAVFERLRPGLLTFRDERGRELFDLPEAPRPPADTPAPVRFLPEFDNVVLGHDDRQRFVAEEHRPRLILPGLRVPATFLVDGFVAGTWTIERKKRAATLTLTPFAKLAKQAHTDLMTEGERLARFMEPEADTVEVAGANPR